MYYLPPGGKNVYLLLDPKTSTTKKKAAPELAQPLGEVLFIT
jgi:hypothetical protein